MTFVVVLVTAPHSCLFSRPILPPILPAYAPLSKQPRHQNPPTVHLLPPKRSQNLSPSLNRPHNHIRNLIHDQPPHRLTIEPGYYPKGQPIDGGEEEVGIEEVSVEVTAWQLRRWCVGGGAGVLRILELAFAFVAEVALMRRPSPYLIIMKHHGQETPSPHHQAHFNGRCSPGPLLRTTLPVPRHPASETEAAVQIRRCSCSGMKSGCGGGVGGGGCVCVGGVVEEGGGRGGEEGVVEGVEGVKGCEGVVSDGEGGGEGA